jgi:hypothetical protein
MPKKLNKNSQTHGKVEAPNSLDQIWGDTGISKYGTLNLEDYKNYLNDLNKSDLQSHASKIGLIPVDNLSTLKERLEREFIKHVSGYTAKSSLEEKEEKISKEAKDILAEGK